MNESQISHSGNSDEILFHSAFGSRRGSGISIANIILFFIGSCLHLIAEASILPHITAFIYFSVGCVSLWFFNFRGRWERFMYTRLFLIGFLSAGIAALFRTFSADTQGDAKAFFEVVTGAASGLSMFEIAAITEGSLAVALWRYVFDLMSLVGFPREQYIGVLVNVLIVALSGVVAIRIVQQVYRYDVYRFNLLILMYSFCGLFWLFSGIFIRDSFILFGVNLLVLVWVYFLNKPGFGFRLILVAFSSILASIFFRFMRYEFVFLPLAMFSAAIFAIIFSQSYRPNKFKIRLLLTFGFLLILLLYVNFGESFEVALLSGKQNYIEEATIQANSGSLGMSLIINQPMPIRLILGSVYLYIFPIPLWSGFQLESSYHLFKSFNAIFILFLLPLLILSFRTLWKNTFSHSSSVMFMLFLVIGFTFAIAGTSMENRHLGIFFVPVFILALLPNMQNAIVKSNYLKILFLVISGFLLIHFAWFLLKFCFMIE